MGLSGLFSMKLDDLTLRLVVKFASEVMTRGESLLSFSLSLLKLGKGVSKFQLLFFFFKPGFIGAL